MLRQRQCILCGFSQQQVNLAQPVKAFAQHQTQLQLQRNAAVSHFDLQGMAQGTQQLATADGIGQVVLTAVFTVEQHQRAAIIERVQLALIQRRRLIQAISIPLQQLHQACARQTSQLLLRAQLHGKYRTWLRRSRLSFDYGFRRHTGGAGVAQI